MTPLLIRGRLGMGDNIMQRAVVREVTDYFDVYLETPWPELVRDLRIKCVQRPTVLRTQTKNAARPTQVWHQQPAGVLPKVVGCASQPRGTMLQGLCDSLGIDPTNVTFDLPQFKQTHKRRKYIVARPATMRKEWPAAARNPRPEYLAMAAAAARAAGFSVVSVADLEPGAEWALEPLPDADETYHAGELHVEDLMALIGGAAGVISGVGFAAPAAVAYRVPLFLIYGGSGAFDGPLRIFDPRMPTGNVTHVIPDRFCLCAERNHATCDKRITSIAKQIDQWLVGLNARAKTAVVA